MPTVISPHAQTSVSTHGYRGGYESTLGDPFGVMSEGFKSYHVDVVPSVERRVPCPTSTLPVGPTLYANLVPQSRVIEYYQVHEDEVRSADGDDAAEARGIGLAMRDIHANFYFSTARARLAGELTRPLKQVDCTLADSGKKIRLWVAQQTRDVRNTLLVHHHKTEASGRLGGLADTLAALRNLQEGWNSYSAPAPSVSAIKNAKTLLTVASEQAIIPQRVEPSAMGGVGVTFSLGDREVSVEFYNDGTAHALFADNAAEEMDTQAVTADAAGYRSLLKEVRPYLYGNPRATATR
jgi:hypothetical protein